MDSIKVNSYSKLVIFHHSEAEHLIKAIDNLCKMIEPEFKGAETELMMLKRLKVELELE